MLITFSTLPFQFSFFHFFFFLVSNYVSWTQQSGFFLFSGHYAYAYRATSNEGSSEHDTNLSVQSQVVFLLSSLSHTYTTTASLFFARTLFPERVPMVLMLGAKASVHTPTVTSSVTMCDFLLFYTVFQLYNFQFLPSKKIYFSPSFCSLVVPIQPSQVLFSNLEFESCSCLEVQIRHFRVCTRNCSKKKK